jgi:hypothetical protein
MMLRAIVKNNPFKSPILPITGLAWLALAYTWLRGHMAFSAITLPGLSTAIPDPFSFMSLCLFKQMTHLPCVFCGMTRSFTLIGQGKLLESISYHWLGIPVYLLTCLFAVAGLLYPQQAHQALQWAMRKRPLAVACSMLFIVWLWKLGCEPRFW